MAILSDLPEDIIAEIMSWLPPESLFRSTCVQKSWYTLVKNRIKNPLFVAKHLNNSKNNSTSSFVFESLKNISVGCLTLYSDEDNKRNLRYVAEDFEPLVPKHGDAFSDLSDNGISHCNGIICFVDYRKSRILLCNPSTRETKLLPDPYFAERDNNFTVRFGLGYDCIANVYKVVRVCGRLFNFKAQVYTLGDDAWRDIMLDHQFRIIDSYPLCKVFHLYCKGFYYWLARKHGIASKQSTMHSFDMHNEEFHTVSLPDIVQSLEYRSTCYTSLTEWNETVVLFSYPRDKFVKTKPIEMWVMHQSSEGNKNSPYWTKYLSIGPGGISKSPTIFLNSEELLIKVFDKGLFSYNIRTNMVKRIHKGYVRWFLASFRYVKSLVSVNGSTLDK
ncbi:hypothetical protein TIFTF001_012580 [Ficus carica]|uniref:F-box domain-containing protein n=1 Tax=Ficus carica TaxID=3494 RepID=A0AA88A2M2_FICCA|nr:hypothetical protein TIFTF001_012580 [Ficus carica]